MSDITLNSVESMLLAFLILWVGSKLLGCFKTLSKYHIPSPIIGGILVSLVTMALHYAGINVTFELPLKDTLMLMFFASVGLSADLRLLKHGGTALVSFLVCAAVFILFQDILGVALSSVLDLEPLLGLLAGSITLSGGHGTGAAWASVYNDQLHIPGALEIAMACATFGLVAGGIFGGPIGTRLVERYQLTSTVKPSSNTRKTQPKRHSRADVSNIAGYVIAVAVILVCAVLSGHIHQVVQSSGIKGLALVPNFVYAIMLGIVLGHVPLVRRKLDTIRFEADKSANLSLGLFLAMALMDLKLWNLFDLALPLLVILMAQLMLTLAFVYWITFRIMGKSYDAAVLAAGHVGFGMGATPTAMMNLKAITGSYGPSPQAYFIVPLVGAFFIDLINLVVIQGYIAFLT
ncbi:sodium/glutamate symporter [Vibrio variabilis]|uniref:sodium/glutamate symporter n=1 Tax=Vibrio variabilis TaxID=990271 RepID=UPI000DD7DC9F|nr:sodium/glutamate symporter [Vibrio variabilis]